MNLLAKRLVAGILIGTLLAWGVGFVAPAGRAQDWYVLSPPLAALMMVLFSRRVSLSLGLAVALAAALSADGPLSFLRLFLIDFVWASAIEPNRLAILVFTLLVLGMVSVASFSGGTYGVVSNIARIARGRRGTQTVGCAMGFSVFFDDYANTAIVGPTARPLFDAARISREKLAYIVDSTAAPLAGLALISTWVGVEAATMQEALDMVGASGSGYAIFVAGVPYRFYCLFALMLVVLVAVTGRDFGPMALAEARAMGGQVIPPSEEDSPRTPAGGAEDALSMKEGSVPRASFALIPLAVVVATIVGGVWTVGAAQGASLLSFGAWQQAFVKATDWLGGAGLTYIFALGGLTGALTAIALPLSAGIADTRECLGAFGRGVFSAREVIVILVMAWSLGTASSQLGATEYLGLLLGRDVSAPTLPIAVFLLAAAVAFSTGSSWGTMAILIPTAGSAAHHIGGEPAMMLAMIAVLDGAILGDHCSPISDTTVLSSLCSGCPHLAHVRTQLPYALLGGAVAGGFGYVGVGMFGLPVILAYLFGLLTLVGVLFGIGRVPSEADAPA